jgi:hypothetical protein
MTQAEDKTYENEIKSQENQLKNIIDMKEDEITAYQQKQVALYAEIKKLRKENEAKKEADKLMIEKIIKYEKEIRKLKKEAKDMLLYP